MPVEKDKAERRYGALILAAGLSSRIAGFKPLSEIGGKPLIEHAIGLFQDSGIKEIVTVIGYRAETLIPVLETASVRYVMNENYQNGMFSSIQSGVAELKDICDAFFLLPVDIPCVCPSTTRQLMDAFNADPSLLVCYPEFDSRRGHPPLIASSLINDVISDVGEGDMRGFLRRYEDQAINVPVTDPFVRLDVDTKQDLFRLENEIKKYPIE